MQRRYSPFYPRTIDARWLKRMDVGHGALVDSLAHGLEETLTAGGARFDLIASERGGGKSHVLGLATAEIKRRLSHDQVVIAAVDPLAEPTSLAMLLAMILAAMPAEPGLPEPASQVTALCAAPAEQQVDRAQGFITSRMGNRSLLVVLDDLDVFLEQVSIEGGGHRLRSILQTQGTWSVLASAGTLDEFTDPSAPFYQTFAVHGLRPFGPDEGYQLLSRLAELNDALDLQAWLADPAGQAGVRVAQLLVGTRPRAMAWLFPHLCHHVPNVAGASMAFARELETYYEGLLGRVSPAQRSLLSILACSWTPLKVAEIAERLMTSHQSTSSQLAKLRARDLVAARRAGRERLYEVADPLLRFAHQMMREPERIEQRLRIGTQLLLAAPEASPMELLRDRPEDARLLESLLTHAEGAATSLRLADLDRGVVRIAVERLPEPERQRLGEALDAARDA